MQIELAIVLLFMEAKLQVLKHQHYGKKVELS
jgi:hypothetical protein